MIGRPALGSLGRVLIQTLAILVLPLAVPAQTLAQNWQFQQRNDGVAFDAYIYPRDRTGFSLSCAARNPSVPGLLPVYYEGTKWTRPDELHLAFSAGAIGSQANNDTREDVLLVIGANAFRLPGIRYDEYASGWNTTLQAPGPMFDAIAAAQSFEIRSYAGTLVVDASGFAAGYANLVNTCRRQFSSLRRPWRAAPAPPPITMRKAAETAVAKGCNGASSYQPDAFLSGDIDGDGVEDVVLDWGGIVCSAGLRRPFCGAAQCSAEVFLSQLYPRRQTSEELLGIGVRLQPLNNGAMAVAVGGSFASCSAAGLQSCEYIYYWNGSDLVNLP